MGREIPAGSMDVVIHGDDVMELIVCDDWKDRIPDEPKSFLIDRERMSTLPTQTQAEIDRSIEERKCDVLFTECLTFRLLEHTLGIFKTTFFESASVGNITYFSDPFRVIDEEIN